MQAIQGKDKVLAFRLLSKASTDKGVKLALQTEHTLKYERATDSVQTKDGAISTDGGLTVTMDITALATRDTLNKMLKDSVINGEVIEIWEIDLASQDESQQFEALYMRGRLDNWEMPANVEDIQEISTSATIDGVPKEGKLTLDQEQLNEIDYAFRNLDVVGE